MEKLKEVLQAIPEVHPSKRLVAFACDFSLFFGITLCLLFAEKHHRIPENVLGLLLGVLYAWLFFLRDCVGAASPGKRITGLVIVSLKNGKTCTPWQCLKRNIIVYGSLGGLLALVCYFGDRRGWEAFSLLSLVAFAGILGCFATDSAFLSGCKVIERGTFAAIRNAYSRNDEDLGSQSLNRRDAYHNSGAESGTEKAHSIAAGAEGTGYSEEFAISAAILRLTAPFGMRELKAAFRREIRRHHPDSAGGAAGPPSKVRAVIEAYKYLAGVVAKAANP